MQRPGPWRARGLARGRVGPHTQPNARGYARRWLGTDKQAYARTGQDQNVEGHTPPYLEPATRVWVRVETVGHTPATPSDHQPSDTHAAGIRAGRTGPRPTAEAATTRWDTTPVRAAMPGHSQMGAARGTRAGPRKGRTRDIRLAASARNDASASRSQTRRRVISASPGETTRHLAAPVSSHTSWIGIAAAALRTPAHATLDRVPSLFKPVLPHRRRMPPHPHLRTQRQVSRAASR